MSKIIINLVVVVKL